MKNIDSVGAKVFDPWGPSIIDDVPLETIWNIAKTGDKFAKFHTELAADGDHGGEYRVGIGLSRLCQVWLATIDHLKNHPDLQRVIVPSIYEKAMIDADVIRPHLVRLNFGKASINTPKEESFGGLKRRKLTPNDVADTVTEAEINESATALFRFLEQGPSCNIRMLVVILSAAGLPFATHAADKTARAWLAHGEPRVTTEICGKALNARYAQQPKASTPFTTEKATGGFFDV